MNNINQVVAVDGINYTYRETLKNLRMEGTHTTIPEDPFSFD